MKTLLTSLCCTVLCFSAVPAGDTFIPRKIIDSPTAGNPSQGSYHLDYKILPGGSLQGELIIGIIDRLYLGISYGGSNLIGTGAITSNRGVGLQGQLRIIDENMALPAVAVGYNNQQTGPYPGPDGVYHIPSKGAYAVASKNYRMLGNLGLHAGINYRIEEEDPRPNLFVMLNKDVNSELSLSLEYDAAINDDVIEWGYLNTGLAWIINNRLQLEFDIKNILEHSRFIDANRELRIVYMDQF